MPTSDTSSRGSLRLAVVSAGLCCSLLAACANQDRTVATTSMAVANAAVADASSVDAGRFAGGELQSARKALVDAGAALNAKEFDRARLLALQAETDASLARAKAASAKAQLAANEINESTRLLRNELGRARQ